MSKPFIVAELSKTWIDGQSANPLTISELFEDVININAKRGYVLRSFQLDRIIVNPTQMNETIIAVFERQQQ